MPTSVHVYSTITLTQVSQYNSRIFPVLVLGLVLKEQWKGSMQGFRPDFGTTSTKTYQHHVCISLWPQQPDQK